MLDLKLVQKHPELVREALARRASSLDIAEFTALDDRRRELLQESEALKAERNKASGDIAKAKREGGEATELLARMATVSDRIKVLEAELSTIEEAETAWLMSVPNIPHQSVPLGQSEHDNPVLRTWGDIPAFNFEPKEHWELGAALGGLDFERAAKITGSRFAVSLGWAARLERALASFMLDVQTREHGYVEVLPPYIVNSASLTGTSQLPKFADDLFKLAGTDYYLIPTAEVPLTNMHRDETLTEDDLPITYCALTPCFRSEAGSYGKDTKGLIRQHQFHKVELVRFEHPERSWEALDLLTRHAEVILQRLGLPYRVITLCTGDMGFGSAKTYDIEVWLPGQQKFREISSCTNFEDFQARRAGIRFKSKQSKKSALVHTLNGSGLAVGRTLVAVLENYQQADGSLVIPEVLRPYLHGEEHVILPV